MFIELATGETVKLEALHLERTYLGLLEGWPNAEGNAEILAEAISRMERLWGERRVHVIAPAVRQEEGHPLLPELTLFAWLTSPTPVNPEYMGSELVVVWFAPERPGVSLSALISEAVRDLPWASLAMDFDY